MRTRTLPGLPRTLAALALLALAALLILPGRAHAQGESPADLRRENDTLRNRVSQLEASNAKLQEDNDRLQKRLAQLESQLARLQSENNKLRNPKTDAPAPADPASTGGQPESNIPADPLACPASLLNALTKSYAEEFKGRQITDDTRSQYIKDVRRWTAEMKRQFRDRVTWTVEIEKAPGDEKLPTDLWVVSPDSHERYHTDPIAIDLGFRATRRIMGEAGQKFWVLEGVFFADPDVNPDRMEAGALNAPPLIGPFAEFKFGLSVTNAMPAPAN